MNQVWGILNDERGVPVMVLSMPIVGKWHTQLTWGPRGIVRRFFELCGAFEAEPGVSICRFAERTAADWRAHLETLAQ